MTSTASAESTGAAAATSSNTRVIEDEVKDAIERLEQLAARLPVASGSAAPETDGANADNTADPKNADGAAQEEEQDPSSPVVRSAWWQASAMQCIFRAQQFRRQRREQLAQPQVARGLKHLEYALAEFPMNICARFLLVGCCLTLGRYEEAKRHASFIYQTVSQVSLKEMKDPVLHLTVAHTSLQLGQHADAVAFLQEANQTYPKHPQPCIVLGELLSNAGRTELAQEMLLKGLERDRRKDCPAPLRVADRARALCCLSECLTQLGMPAEAEKRLAEAQQVDGTGVWALHCSERLKAQKLNPPGSSSLLASAALADAVVSLARADSVLQLGEDLRPIPIADATTTAARQPRPSPRPAYADTDTMAHNAARPGTPWNVRSPIVPKAYIDDLELGRGLMPFDTPKATKVKERQRHVGSQSAQMVRCCTMEWWTTDVFSQDCATALNGGCDEVAEGRHDHSGLPPTDGSPWTPSPDAWGGEHSYSSSSLAPDSGASFRHAASPPGGGPSRGMVDQLPVLHGTDRQFSRVSSCSSDVQQDAGHMVSNVNETRERVPPVGPSVPLQDAARSHRHGRPLR
eukprot:gnl/TRDRNA2_/TRDRNA2_154052_c0_seq1.p1 gnl/TRDRNA2_/TRDRNA2_154052_c0~~gnl/TRDRNA2_/TRDRNA2_154052_c0_seq1.p1  ORF type:complete len:575 (-),score=77.36 gnl/TRDRNA2_/TRDRNA2_154052_c0_seq1:163-1887(-)